MQSPHNNQSLLFKDFLARKHHVPEKRLPYYLRWVSRFHEFCNRSNLDDNAPESIAAYVHELAKNLEDWQVQQAKEAVRLFRYFTLSDIASRRICLKAGPTSERFRNFWATRTSRQQ